MKTPIFWIEGPWPGQLAIVPRPRGGDWLEDEIRSWKSTGIMAVVSTLAIAEIADFDLDSEPALCERTGIQLIAFPISDRGVPQSRKAAEDLVKALEAKLAKGENIAVHCRQGIGRSSLVAASVLLGARTLEGFGAVVGPRHKKLVAARPQPAAHATLYGEEEDDFVR